MILVDTSVWIDFFRGTSRASALAGLLEDNRILLHKWVLGELVLGGLGPRRDRVVADLQRLPAAPLVRDDEVLALVVTRQFSGRGIGWVDSHLLASSLVAGSSLWTFDRSLAAVAEDLNVATLS